MSSPVNASLLRLKLLDALRSGDTSRTKEIMTELLMTKNTTQTTDIIQLKGQVLHYAVQIAPLPLIQYLVQNADEFNININSQDPDGNTPLHLAALLSRLEVVKYLLSLPNINDTIVNLKKKQPVEVCKDLDIAQLMQFERAKFVESVAVALRNYFSKRDFDNLENLLVSNPRASELLDINGADPETGNTVLHEFIMKEDLQMCDWILKHGGDPFKRDKRGKLPIDLIPNKNEPLKKLLKTATKDQTIMDPVISTSNAIKSGGAPTYKGYLRKWTNFASGYKLRYFVLDCKGVLSYYTDQDDTNNACRGSLNLGYAYLHLDSSEKLKFEIIGKNGIRWHLKANHPIETNRWVWTLQNAITIAKDNIKKKRVVSNESQTEPEPLSARNSMDEPEGKRRLRNLIPGRRKHKRNTSQTSLNSNGSDADDVVSNSSNFRKLIGSPNLVKIKENKFLEVNHIRSSMDEDYTDFDYENFDLDNVSGDYSSDSESIMRSHESADDVLPDQISTVRKTVDIELSGLIDLFKQVSSIKESNVEVYQTGLNTLKSIHELFKKYDSLVQVNDKRVLKKLERQLEVNRLWESSIRQLENEIAKREQKLEEFEGKNKQIKKFITSAGISKLTKPNELLNESNKANAIALPVALSKGEPVTTPNEIIEMLNNDSDDEFFDADEFGDAASIKEATEEGETPRGTPEVIISSSDHVTPEQKKVPVEEKQEEEKPIEKKPEEEKEPVEEKEQTKEKEEKEKEPIKEEKVQEKSKDLPVAGTQESPINKETNGDVNEARDDNNKEVSEKQKVDKSDSNEKTIDINKHFAKENLKTENQAKVAKILEKEGSFLGYENPPRKKLAMDEDDRPKLGLWSILKSMVGKDMTRMTLPVSFNEPTSLLQRLVEDIEYSELLDKAASFEDSTLRMVYVSAFAISEYSSTINRIAKPFNPLLGETYEYSRPDKGYRIFVEQVKHHPPISACCAQSPKWDYYGENAVESQLRINFDFKHLGKMFCVIRPDKPFLDKNGKEVVEELYSWKKVNTSVVGIITGNPKVDNYGQMEVTNHTTGDVMVVDMKQRGWKASSAYQLSGQVVDKNGKPHWAIGGRWSSMILAKKIDSSGMDAKTRKALVDNTSEEGEIPTENGKFLVWQVAPRPKIPFNLTGFATTLNGIDDNLKAWLPPTDTRLRPDQRAMEDGKYDAAADIKHRVEEKQRAARKRRELNKETYKPLWFVKKKHPVTGDGFWEFQGKYWQARLEKKLEGCADIF